MIVLLAGAGPVLAQNNFGDTESGGLAGPMGLFIILLLVIGTVLLVRNMNSRLRRLPRSFPPPPRRGTGEAVEAARDGTPEQDRAPDRDGGVPELGGSEPAGPAGR